MADFIGDDLRKNVDVDAGLHGVQNLPISLYGPLLAQQCPAEPFAIGCRGHELAFLFYGSGLTGDIVVDLPEKAEMVHFIIAYSCNDLFVFH